MILRNMLFDFLAVACCTISDVLGTVSGWFMMWGFCFRMAIQGAGDKNDVIIFDEDES